MLRGHVMAEAAALQVVRRQELGNGLDGVLPVPAFLEAGRLTAADIHWAASTRTWSRPARPNSRRIRCPATPHQT
jgi:hypothetical protein